MTIFPLKVGDTKLLTGNLALNGADLTAVPTAVTLKIGTMYRTMSATASPSQWTYRFTATDYTYLQPGTYEAEMLITWAVGEETAPTSGRLKIKVEAKL